MTVLPAHYSLEINIDSKDSVYSLLQVAASRASLEGELIVDGIDQNTGAAAGNSKFINVEMPYYIGGVSNDVAQGGAKNVEVRQLCMGFDVKLLKVVAKWNN